ncbi:hypothetical protein [Butyrivibrio sp. INlla14]|uniref:hypothetical protein n=1 Tax=Butyrivibrio sp. INlla14 TaxID=1520808 RepID=UPI000876279E|nr:hypothetical protein [Butyrivibrio sp. INlla14]SCY14284.1 hypothetical protein SAMN02910371_01199 [Butyrivibrio sp. INlla14]
MELYLAKTLDGMKKYGPIYDLSMEPAERVESYQFGFEENEWLLDNVIDGINAECDTLLDDGDYDFISADKCKALKDYLKKMDKSMIPSEYHEVIQKLIEFSDKAIEYGTGMAIDL